MKQTVRIARKALISLIGFPLFLVGLILIPLPGPGLVISFLALLILSMEYGWADNHKSRAKQQFKKIYDSAKARADKIEQLGDGTKK